MMMNMNKAIFGLILLLSTNSLASGSGSQCPYTTKRPDKDQACFKYVIEIEGLKYDDVCTKHEVDRLEDALLEFHNANIDCVCPGNKIEYTKVDIINLGIGEGDGGDLDWCKKKNNRVAPFRKLSVSGEEVDFVDVDLDELSGRKLEFDTVGVEASVIGDCGVKCPDTPFAGAPRDCIDCGYENFDDYFVVPSFRRLGGGGNGRDDSKCVEPLFVETLNDNGFEEVTGLEVILVRNKRVGFCTNIAPTPAPTPSPTPYGKKGGNKKGGNKKGGKR